MALQSFTITVGAAKDSDNNDKNYVSGQTIYIKRTNGTLASIYRDLAGTSQIAQDGLSNVTNSKGQFTFFVEAGDYNAEYQSQVTPITVVGADYFNSRIDETVNQIILDLSTSRGFRVQGTFAAGFTYELPNDVGLDASGNAWIYTDSNALPFTVPAATSPSFPTYTQVTFNSASGVIDSQGTNVQDYINKNLSSFNSLADAAAYDYSEIPSGVKINRLGYYSASDGGSNWGILKKGDSTSLVDDGGSISLINNDAVNGVWIEWNTKGKSLNAKKFGAGFGLANDNIRLQNIIDKYSSLYLPDGDYRLSDTLKTRAGTTLKGSGCRTVFVAELDNTKPAILTYSGSGEPTAPNQNIGDFTVVGTAKCAVAFSHFTVSSASNIALESNDGRRFTGIEGFAFEYFWGSNFKNLFTNGAVISFSPFVVNEVVLASVFENLYTSNISCVYCLWIDGRRKDYSTGSAIGNGRLKFIVPTLQGATNYGVYVTGYTNIEFDVTYSENIEKVAHIDKGSSNITFRGGLLIAKNTADHVIYIGNSDAGDGRLVGPVNFDKVHFDPDLPFIMGGGIWSTGLLFDGCYVSGKSEDVHANLRRTSATTGDLPVTVRGAAGGGTSFENPLYTCKADGFAHELVSIRVTNTGAMQSQNFTVPLLDIAPVVTPHP